MNGEFRFSPRASRLCVNNPISPDKFRAHHGVTEDTEKTKEASSVMAQPALCDSWGLIDANEQCRRDASGLRLGVKFEVTMRALPQGAADARLTVKNPEFLL
jgi:hypothetical protein